MIHRIRRLNISLAAKCQLLFGAAVVLIIAAALFWPWQRTERLMREVDDRVAGTLADQVIREHAMRPVEAQALAFPTTAPANGTTQPAATTQPLRAPPPRLIPAAADTRGLTWFERRSLGRFTKNPYQQVQRDRYDRRDGAAYRYARPVFATQSCLQCHAPAGDPPATGTATAQAGATTLAAATAPGQAAPFALNEFVGIVAVDIESQVDASQLLLNRVVLLAAGMLAGSLAIVVFYLITTRLILQPVRVLQETAEKVSKGDLNIRSDISTGDEFQQLSETFNTMLTNLKSNADQLRAINKSLDLKLGQMAESNVALYEANKLKTEFLANVSHELRTPLNSILGFADLLRDNLGTVEGKPQRYVQNILQSGTNLLNLINDLLDLAKIEAGRMEVRSEPLSVPDLFEGLANILRPLLEQKKLSIVTEVGRDVPILQTDAAKLQQILYNFLSNAIKFSPPGGQINLTARRSTPDRVRVAVTDRGPGIDPEKHKVIFEKFRQIDGSVTRQHSGTGLGLAISKELAVLLGGEIGVESEPGKGATFWLAVPLKVEAGTKDVRAQLIFA